MDRIWRSQVRVVVGPTVESSAAVVGLRPRATGRRQRTLASPSVRARPPVLKSYQIMAVFAIRERLNSPHLRLPFITKGI